MYRTHMREQHQVGVCGYGKDAVVRVGGGGGWARMVTAVPVVYAEEERTLFITEKSEAHPCFHM